MGPFLITVVLMVLLCCAVVYISVRVKAQNLLGKVRFRRVRRVRTLTPMPDGTTVEETIVETSVETTEEESPVEEESRRSVLNSTLYDFRSGASHLHKSSQINVSTLQTSAVYFVVWHYERVDDELKKLPIDPKSGRRTSRRGSTPNYHSH